MGKKKASEENSQPQNAGLPKVYTDYADTIFDAGFLLNRKKVVVSVSPSFDLATGGIPEGSFVVLTGREKFGKSLSALYIAAKAQRPEYADPELCPDGRKVIFFNVEHRIKDRDLLGIQGLNLNKFVLIQSSPGNILSSEDWCDRIVRFVNEEPGSILIVDSFSLLSARTEQASGMGFQDRGKSYAIMGELMRKISAPRGINRNILIGITHVQANTSGYGAAIQEKSANALKFGEDIKLWAKSMEPWRTSDDKTASNIGQKVEWHTMFSSIAAPGARVISHIRFGQGIDEYSELFELGKEFGLIEGETWSKFSFLGEDGPKFQGAEKSRQALIDNVEWYTKLKNDLYSMAGLEHLLPKQST